MQDLLTKLNTLFRLSFEESNLETNYQDLYLKEHHYQNILALKITIFVYITYVPLTYFIIRNEELLLLFISIFSMSGAVWLLIIKNTLYFKDHTHFVLYLAGFIAGVGPVIFYLFTTNSREIFQVDILLPIVAAFVMYGISFSLALIITITIVLFFIVVAFSLSLDNLDIFMALYVMLAGSFIAGMGGYISEKITRRLFLEKLKSDEFKFIVENSNDSVGIYDIETHKYIYANSSLLNRVGYSIEEIIGMRVDEVHTSMTKEREEHIVNSLKSKGSFSDVMGFKKEDGSNYYLNVSIQYGSYNSKKVIISSASDVSKLKEAELKIKEMAFIDPLTKLYNRYKLDDLSMHQIHLLKRYGQNASLIICDIDHFKKINDTYGHLSGDRILQNMAKTIKSSVRESDLVSRWGGEEFAILLPNTNIEEALITAKQLHKNIGLEVDEEVGNVYVSCGVSQLLKEDTQNSWFKRVDASLYEAKKSGRNRICYK